MHRIILVVFVLGLSLIACRKGTLPEEYYFGKVNVASTQVSDAPSLDVYFGNEKIGTVVPTGVASSFTLPANKAGKISIYKASTDSLVADTMITVVQNSSIDLKVICSDLLGVKGFLSNDSNVAADSVKLQFMYTFDAPFNNYPEVDLHILRGSAREDIGVVVKGLKMGQLNSQVITLPHVQDGEGILYYGMLKDVATGEFIQMKYKSRDFFLLLGGDSFYDGHLNLVQIYDNDGDETNNKILANVNTL
jgi:hypothetical protein